MVPQAFLPESSKGSGEGRCSVSKLRNVYRAGLGGGNNAFVSSRLSVVGEAPGRQKGGELLADTEGRARAKAQTRKMSCLQIWEETGLRRAQGVVHGRVGSGH